MTPLSIIHPAAVMISMVLGTLVYRTNPQRATNQIFAILSFALGFWLISMAIAFQSPSAAVATWSIRCCHFFGITFPFLFDCLRCSIAKPGQSLVAVLKHSPVWLATTVVMACLSLTPWIVSGAYTPPPSPGKAVIPEPIFGALFGLYVSHYAVLFGLLVSRFFFSVKHAKGIQRAELNFTLVGAAGSIAVGLALAIIPPLVTGSSQSARFASLGVVVLDSIIAYGIATRRIMDVAYVFRLFTAYALLTTYLVALYCATWWVSRWLLSLLNHHTSFIPHIAAAICTAYALAPTHGRMQRFSNRLFLNLAPLDIGAIANRVSQLIHSISTVDELLRDFAVIVTSTMGVDRFVILLASNGDFRQRYPSEDSGNGIDIPRGSALADVLSSSHDTLVPDVVRRLKPSAMILKACDEMERMGMAVAVGLHSGDTYEGMVLMGPRLSGRIYGIPEQVLLRVVANQLAIALNNARLYTEVQNAKIYNDLLVDNLASGVIASDRNSHLTCLLYTSPSPRD